MPGPTLKARSRIKRIWTTCSASMIATKSSRSIKRKYSSSASSGARLDTRAEISSSSRGSLYTHGGGIRCSTDAAIYMYAMRCYMRALNH